MYELDGKKYYETMTEAKLDMIFKISQRVDMSEVESNLLKRLKQSVENHENMEVLFKGVERDIQSIDYLRESLAMVKRSDFLVLSTEEINKHPSITAVDTFLPVELLLQPSALMLEAAQKVNQLLIAVIEEGVKNQFHVKGIEHLENFTNFAVNMLFENDHTYPGAFKLSEINRLIGAHNASHSNSTLTTIPEDFFDPGSKSRLTQEQVTFIINLTLDKMRDPDTSLSDLMMIQAKAAQYLMKQVPLLNELAKGVVEPSFWRALHEEFPELSSYDEFLQKVRETDPSCYKYRTAISDVLMYKSKFYTIDSTRGRGIPVATSKTASYGIVAEMPGADYRENLPKSEVYEWVDWTTCQYFPKSIIVKSMVEHETPFVSSFSGTTSLLMNLMLTSGVFETQAQQQIYLLNAMAYIVGMGFHSVHEVLAPTAHCLRLLDQDCYPTKIVADGHGFAPQYHTFYEMMAQLDPEFNDKYQKSWNHLMQWYQQTYLQCDTANDKSQYFKNKLLSNKFNRDRGDFFFNPKNPQLIELTMIENEEAGYELLEDYAAEIKSFLSKNLSSDELGKVWRYFEEYEFGSYSEFQIVNPEVIELIFKAMQRHQAMNDLTTVATQMSMPKDPNIKAYYVNLRGALKSANYLKAFEAANELVRASANPSVQVAQSQTMFAAPQNQEALSAIKRTLMTYELLDKPSSLEAMPDTKLDH